MGNITTIFATTKKDDENKEDKKDIITDGVQKFKVEEVSAYLRSLCRYKHQYYVVQSYSLSGTLKMIKVREIFDPFNRHFEYVLNESNSIMEVAPENLEKICDGKDIKVSWLLEDFTKWNQMNSYVDIDLLGI